jgi:hypothetical protein
MLCSIKMYHIFVHSFINFILFDAMQFQIPVLIAGGVDQPLGSPAGQNCVVTPRLPFVSVASTISRVSPAGQGYDVMAGNNRSVFRVNLTKLCCSCYATYSAESQDSKLTETGDLHRLL